MKKYRLKKWYPSLQKKTIEGNIANWDYDEKAYTVIQNGDRIEILDKTEVENNPDFWEEMKQPLFATEDGVEVFEGDKTIPVDVGTWKKHFAEENNGLYEHFKYFFYESNADEYIWRNKPVFSYEDFIKWGNIPYPRAIEQLAKERI